LGRHVGVSGRVGFGGGRVGWGLMLSKTSLEQVYANRMTTMAQVDGMIRNFYNTRPACAAGFST